SRTSNAPFASGWEMSPVTVRSREAVPPVIPWRASWRSTNGIACSRTLLLLRWTTALPRAASAGTPSRLTSTGTSASSCSCATADLRRPFEIQLLPVRRGRHVEREGIQADVRGGRCRVPVGPEPTAQPRSGHRPTHRQHAAAAPARIEGDAVDLRRAGGEDDV